MILDLPVPAASISEALILWFLAIALQVLQFLAPVALMAWRQPRRNHFVTRCVVTLVVFTVYTLATSTLDWMARLIVPAESMVPYVLNFATYALCLCLLVPATLLCFDTGRWNALLYATAGYTIQNLGTGAGELIRILCEQATHDHWGLVLTSCVTDASALVVLAACYRPFICKIRDGAPLRNDSRGMLGMVGAVIAVVIANDVVIRGLDNQWNARVIPLPFLVTFRVTHLVICLFVLYAEFENLFNVRLRVEVTAQERIAAERDRQYELSRQNVRSINERMHDIRHQVLRELESADANIPRETLADVARSINVYDAILHTGNDALDTILSQKQLQCAREGITLTCVADGAALDFMPASEVYALFGDLLDSALAIVGTVADEEQRSVSLNVHRVGALVSVHMSGTCAKGAASEEELVAARSIARRYGGALTVTHEDERFSVDAVLPESA